MIKKNCLVIGGTGFIGYHLLKKLSKKKNYNLYSLSRTKPVLSKKVRNIKYLICDLAKKKKNKLSFK